MKLKREAFSDCISNVAAQAGVDEDKAFGIIQSVADYGEKLRKDGQPDPFGTAAKQLSDQQKITAVQNRLDSLRNAVKRNRIVNSIDSGSKGLKGSKAGIARARTLSSVLTWDPHSKNNDNIESQYHGLTRLWQASVGNVLKQAGLQKAAISKELDYEVAERMRQMSGSAPDPSVKISPQGKTIAEAIWPAVELARRRMNNAGAFISKATDFIDHTRWDPRQLRLAGNSGGSALRRTLGLEKLATPDKAFEAWWAKDGPRMADKTFEHLVPKEGQTLEDAKKKFGKSVYNATVSGVHLQQPNASGLYDDGEGYIPPAWEGTRNLGRKVSQQRTIYWKDSKSWVDHMHEFGGGQSIYASSMHALDDGARRTSLMEKLGTNPEAAFKSIVRRTQEKYRDDPEALQAFNKEVSGNFIKANLDDTLSYLDGRANIPKNQQWADITNQALKWIAASKLGGVVIPHMTSAPMTISSELAHHGVSHLEGIGKVLKAVLTGKGSEEKQQIMSEAGAYAQGYNLLIGSKLQTDSGVPGYISWGANNFMRLTGLPGVLDKLQADGIKATLMTKLGNNLTKEFSELDPNQTSIMQRYGIGKSEWDLLRGTEGHPSIEGQTYLTPKAVDSIKDTDILNHLGLKQDKMTPQEIEATVQKFKWSLSDKYLMYLNDSSERGTVTPGAREKATFLKGARPGTLGWAVGRSFAQFKMWPLAAWNQIINREIGYSLSKGQAAANIGWIIALSTAGGALRMSVNDAQAGRPQRNFLEPGNLISALGQGGGLGIYGDYLFGETSRSSNTSLANIGGPVLEDIDTLLKMIGQFRADLSSENPKTQAKAVHSLWAPLARFAIGHIPFANLMYLKGALDYMVFYHIYEAASPGWWERTNRRLEKEQGKTMLGYSPGQGVPYGIPGVTLHEGQ